MLSFFALPHAALSPSENLPPVAHSIPLEFACPDGPDGVEAKLDWSRRNHTCHPTTTQNLYRLGGDIREAETNGPWDLVRLNPLDEVFDAFMTVMNFQF